MKALRTLVDQTTTQKQKTEAATTIITNYDLPFNTDDIIKAFERLYNMYSYAALLLRLSLTKNLRMFIALIYATLDNKMSALSCDDLTAWNATLGCTYRRDSNVNSALQTWSTLYDYYEFDISELTFSNEMRKGIQKHIDSKGRYTKPAIK